MPPQLTNFRQLTTSTQTQPTARQDTRCFRFASPELPEYEDSIVIETCFFLRQLIPEHPDNDIDETAQLSFDMDAFKATVLRHQHSDKDHVQYGHHLTAMHYSALRRNLAHIRVLDGKFRSWLEDGSVTPEAARKVCF